MAFFVARGLPTNPEVLELANTHLSNQRFFEVDSLMDWMTKRGTRTYLEFLVQDPLWTFQTFANFNGVVFSENRQVFFVPDDEITPEWLTAIGELFHPRTNTVIAAVIVQLLIFTALASVGRDASQFSIVLVLSIFLAGAFLMMFVSIFGDASNIIRHSLGSVIPIRLFVWLLPPLIIDQMAVLVGLPALD
jgi:hypothetical protein